MMKKTAKRAKKRSKPRSDDAIVRPQCKTNKKQRLNNYRKYHTQELHTIMKAAILIYTEIMKH